MRSRSITCLNPSGLHQMAYVEWGPLRAERTVVCVHGLTRNGRDFDVLAKRLVERGWRVVCPDVVGRGKSHWLANGMLYGYPQYLSDLNTLLARFEGPVDWIGTSMGGLIGMMLAAREGVGIRSLVINDVGPLVPEAALKRIGEYVGQDHSFADVAEAEAHLRVIHAPFGDLSDEQWAALTRHSLRLGDDGRYRLAYDPAIAAAFAAVSGDVDLWAIWDQVSCPAFVLRGADSDLLLPDVLDRMVGREAPTEALVVEGCGHAPALMSNDQIDPIADWIDRQGKRPGVADFTEKLPDLKESWPWKGGDLQTVRNRLRGPRAERLAGFDRLEFEMPDGSGDRLLGSLSHPEGGPTDKPLALVIHGLTGCEDSHYVVESACRLRAQGHPVLRLNLRGAGPARAVCRFQYHAGRSEDIRAVLDQLDPALCRNGVVAVGFSLGGNMLLKLLGEEGKDTPFRAAVSICSPLDLAATQRRMSEPRNWLYHRFFIRRMKDEALQPIADVDQADRDLLQGVQTVYEFDDQFVAPRNGFAGADNYYEINASEHFLGAIACPTLIIAAENDPIVPAETYRRQRWQVNGALVPLLTNMGGHCGYHSPGFAHPWSDEVAARFLAEV